MKRKNFLLIIQLGIVLLACNANDSTSQNPSGQTFLFQDGFETLNNSVNELFPTDASRWSTIQQTNPSNATNEISIIDSEFSEGENALRIVANQSDAILSKMDIEKNGLNISEGANVTITADFFINGTQYIENLLLIDLECCSCWDPTVGDNYGSENQCPGVRLIMSGGNDFLSIERGKISGETLQQSTIAFPRNEWVTVKWEMTLSPNNAGINKLSINGSEVINENAMNMPNATIFSEVFANQGIDFTLQEPTFYERVQIGATANPNAETVELFVDNFSIKVN